MNRVTVNAEVCKGCALCTAACPKRIMALDAEKLNTKGYHPAACVDQAACIACAMCAVMCPDSAIRVEKELAGVAEAQRERSTDAPKNIDTEGGEG